MKNKKKYLIMLIVLILMLILILLLFIFKKKSKVVNEEPDFFATSWISYKNEYYINETKDEIDESIYSLLFDEKKITICNVQVNECYETSYILNDNILSLEKDNSMFLFGQFELKYENNELILKQEKLKNEIYILYYFKKCDG